MNIADLKNSSTYYASESLLAKAKEKESDFYINCAYTDYGGTFFDNVVIQYFKENYPNSILFEHTSWNGENAFIFGDIAKKFFAESEGYLLGFEGIEDFYINMENTFLEKTFEYIYETFEEKLTISKKEFKSILIEAKECGELNFNIEATFVDYNEKDIEFYLLTKKYLKDE